MELRQLRYFVALAETGNFHRAAERLNMSQPPLTVAIRKLEDDLGTTLFVRGTRGVTLTPAGRAALDPAKATLTQAERFREAAREGATGARGRLRVGFVGSATFELLPRVVPEYRRRFPAVELVLEEVTSFQIARGLAAGELDVGLVRLPLTEVVAVDTVSIDADEMQVALPIGSDFARDDEVALEALSGEPFILQSGVSVLHSITLNACHAAGFVPIVAQEAPQLSAILALVGSGLGVALVPSRASRSLPDGVCLVRLSTPVPIETGVALPRDLPSQMALNFAKVATDTRRLS